MPELVAPLLESHDSCYLRRPADRRRRRLLSAECGRGFSKRNLHHMLRFVEVFPDPEIAYSLRSQLGWTHIREVIALDDPLQCRFYLELCRLEPWSTRTLQAKIAGMLYEGTALAKRPKAST